MNASRLVDSNLHDIVDTAIDSFQATINRLRGTKPDAVLLETEAEELFMLRDMITQQMSLKITEQYKLGSKEWHLALKELDSLTAKITDAIDFYQQEELALIRNNN